MLTIYIPTYKRVNRQTTWSMLPPEVREFTYLVAPPEEAETLDMLGYNVLSCPEKGIANTRQWIIDQHDTDERGDILWMMDDDLRFSARRTDDPRKFTKMEPESAEFLDMVAKMDDMMQRVPLGSVATRSGANRVTSQYRMNARIFDTWAINVSVAREHGIQVNRQEFMEDFDTTLQFLTKGFHTLSLNMFVCDDTGPNIQGGCGVYRDSAGQELAALQLAATWPGYVKTEERPAWDGMDGETRLDVRVQWKHAWEDGVRWRKVNGIPLEPLPTWEIEQLI